MKVKYSSCRKLVDSVKIHGAKKEDNNLILDILSLRYIQAHHLNLGKMSGIQIQVWESFTCNLNYIPKSSSLLVIFLPLISK